MYFIFSILSTTLTLFSLLLLLLFSVPLFLPHGEHHDKAGIWRLHHLHFWHSSQHLPNRGKPYLLHRELSVEEFLHRQKDT